MKKTMSNLSRRKFLKGATALAAINPLGTLNQLSAQVQYENQNGILVPKNWPKGRPYWDMPVDQLEIQNSKNLKKTLDDAVVNPFHQPNLIYDKLNCYGGGDYDGFGIGQGDIDAAAAGTNDYRLDVNGDTIVNTTDANMLQAYKDGNRGYLESHWNFLQNRGERESWLQKMLAIDKTDEKQWISGEFISRDFAKLLHTNYYGFVKENQSDNDIAPNLTPLTNGLFNIPLYYMTVSAQGFGHGMNAILLGDNPLNFSDWSFVEPQTDEINIKPGTWNIPYNSELTMRKITKYLNYTQNIYPSISDLIVKFNIDSSGNAIVIDQHPNLLLTRPTVGIEDEKNTNLSKKYSFDKIYPNPTNARVNINYNLPERNNISIDVYNMLGKKVNTLEKGMQEQGAHNIKWNANNQPSGIYNIILRNENKILDKRKITIIK